MQLLIEPNGGCSHQAVRKAVDQLYAMEGIDGFKRCYKSNSSRF